MLSTYDSSMRLYQRSTPFCPSHSRSSPFSHCRATRSGISAMRFARQDRRWVLKGPFAGLRWPQIGGCDHCEFSKNDSWLTFCDAMSYIQNIPGASFFHFLSMTTESVTVTHAHRLVCLPVVLFGTCAHTQSALSVYSVLDKQWFCICIC